MFYPVGAISVPILVHLTLIRIHESETDFAKTEGIPHQRLDARVNFGVTNQVVKIGRRDQRFVVRILPIAVFVPKVRQRLEIVIEHCLETRKLGPIKHLA